MSSWPTIAVWPRASRSTSLPGCLGAPILAVARAGHVFLLFGARDTGDNGAVVLRDYVNEKLAGPRANARTTRPPGMRDRRSLRERSRIDRRPAQT